MPALSSYTCLVIVLLVDMLFCPPCTGSENFKVPQTSLRHGPVRAGT